MKKINIKPKVVAFLVSDVALIVLMTMISLLVRFDFNFNLIWSGYWDCLISYGVINIVTTLVVFYLFKMYAYLWKYAGSTEFVKVVLAVAISDVLQYVGMHLLHLTIPRSYFAIYFMLLTLVTILSRFGYRMILGLRDLFGNKNVSGMKNVLLYGAGEAGQIILKEIQTSKYIQNKYVPCILDDDPAKKDTYLQGIRIIGGKEHLNQCVKKYNIDEIIIAIPSLVNGARKDLVQLCHKTGCKVSILPGMYQIINQRLGVADLAGALRTIELEDLLGREPVRVDMESVMGYISNKIILVTGGGGSIGSELCRQIANALPKQLIILDIYENNAYDLQNELKRKYPYLNLQVVIASVRDRDRIHSVFTYYHPDLVFHAAAHKHVPLMEDNPWEAIKNNVLGTEIVASEAHLNNVQKFVMISTDKAVRPTNIMGASKRICEMIIQDYAKRSATEYVAVRFGNVLGSNGSVVPLFKKQIAEGGPVTVTHPDIIRYFMTIPEAVSLVLQAGAYANGGEIFILDMGAPVRILDMAENLIRLSGYTPGVDIEIQFTGLRPGEKLYEELLMEEEKTETKNRRIFIGQQIPVDSQFLHIELAKLKEAAYGHDPDIRKYVQHLVPEYSIKDDKNIIQYAKKAPLAGKLKQELQTSNG